MGWGDGDRGALCGEAHPMLSEWRSLEKATPTTFPACEGSRKTVAQERRGEPHGQTTSMQKKKHSQSP